MFNFKMFSRSFFLLSTILTALSLSLSSGAFADQGRDKFAVNQILSDGKDGRVWRQWRQGIRNEGVQNVVVVLRRINGGNDTSVNLRYGDGPTFENKQFYLTDNNIKSVSFNVGGAAPNGQPLVLNAYKGEVQVSNIVVNYVGAAAPQRHSGHTRWGEGKYNSKPGMSRPGRDAYDNRASNENAAVRRCRSLDRIRRPRIEIGRVKPSGGLFSGKYRINGSVYGACIEEAGYFERGRLKDEVQIPLDDRYTRREFSFQVRSGRSGEIRVYTIDGREDIVDVDELIKEEGGGGLLN